jgi:pimeloyl-ACP methyl ester carboxylesterase
MTMTDVVTVPANGLELAYQQMGDPEATPLLLVMGLNGQMLSWPDALCQQLCEAGYFVTRFDNRDIGLSTHISGAGMPDIGAALRGETGGAPYLVADMADDAAALLEALGIAPAHVVGVSMGGMIVQALTIRHPDKVRSLTSIMSTPFAAIGPPTGEVVEVLLRPPPTTKEEAVEASVESFRVIGSPDFPHEDDWRRGIAAASYDRDHDPEGPARQLMAILCSPDRSADLAGVRVPTLVVHGAEDPLIQIAGGRATAAAVPGAELLVIDGMGHDLPVALWDTFVDRISALTARADGR